MKLVPEAVSRKVAHTALLSQKNSPQILFGAGIAGMIGSTVLACRATLKMDELLEKTQNDVKIAKSIEHREYSEKDRQKDVSLIYVQTSMNIVRLYGPAVILGGASIAALTQSHNLLSKRNAALTAAYAALEKSYNEYRARVVEKYGEEEDRHLRYGTEVVEIEDEASGQKVEVVRVASGEPSAYARFFDQLCSSWSKDPEYNFLFIRCQQNYANDLLKARGHVMLNEVYDMLGIPRSKAGAVVGWILMPDGSTDNYIDFGVFDDNDRARDFVNGREGSILLDFNVDGVIFDKIDTPTEALSWQLGN
jgi:hypothetical protein